MKITRDGKVYELTANELSLAYNEMLHENWRCNVADAIDRNESHLAFGLDYTMDEFIQECVDKIEEGYYGDDDDEKYDEIVFDMAESMGVWQEDEEDDDDF